MRAMPLRDGPAILLGALGLVSGVASAVIGADRSLDALQPVAAVFLLQAGLLPIGVCFAVAIGFALWRIAQRPLASLAATILTLYAWSAAVHVAIRTQRNTGDDGHLLAASLAAGAVGAGLTHLAASLALPQLRRVSATAITVATGALLGLLFYCGERGFIDKRALFVIWQPTVAFVIGLAAARPTSAPR